MTLGLNLRASGAHDPKFTEDLKKRLNDEEIEILEKFTECTNEMYGEYYSAAEPPVRCGESHLSGLTEPPIDSYSA